MMIYILFFFLQFLPSCVSQPQNKQQTKHCCMLGIKAVKRVNPRSTHHKKILFFYCFIYIKIYDIIYDICYDIYDDGWSLDSLWQPSHDICKSNHYAVHFKLNIVLYVNYILIKWEEKNTLHVT